MATRGRKPKPTALKVLEGNPGKRPLNDREPVPPKATLNALRGSCRKPRRNGSGLLLRWKPWAC